MRIQHNVPALNSYRNYSNNVGKVSKNLEKLSTGYKINRAGDDAAGLAISEKMRIQITGLEKAQENAKAGINLVQTAEGALTEVHDMLNRMFSLAEQSANGTYDDSVDRNQLQKEVNQLRDEIDRIADSTNYNGIQLLDGSMEKKTVSSAVQDVGASFDKNNPTAALNGFAIINDGDPGKKAQAGVFTVDLSNVKISASANDEVKFAVFGGANADGTQLSLGKLDKGKSIEGKDLVDKIVKAWNDANPEVGPIGGKVNMTASASLDGTKVIFTMNNPSAKDWEVKSALTFMDLAGNKIETADPTATTPPSLTINGAQEIEVTSEVEPVSTAHERVYAQAKFTLDDKLVANGQTLQIGDETYVFAVGRNSRYTGMDHVIDLTDFEAADFKDDKNLAIAARRLTEAASGNKMFKVSSNTDETDDGSGNGTGKVIYLTEREGAVDYTVNDLQGTASGAKDGKWAGLIKIGIVDTSSSTQGLTLQIGDTAETFNQLNVSIKDMHVSALNLSKIDISLQGNAQTAMDLIKSATNYVSDVRGGLGALQNRLDHTINNLSVATENITDAESNIRDVDVAKEMMAYTKNNILVQSSQAMLAQANQLPQGVLQLLG